MSLVYHEVNFPFMIPFVGLGAVGVFVYGLWLIISSYINNGSNGYV